MQSDEPVEKTNLGEEEFSLSNKENLLKLNIILDELILELNEDKKSFVKNFKNLPLNIYLKIDSLRNTMLDKKSESFRNVAIKAKFVSKEFHNQFK